jgi:hypothetical protein
MAGSVGVAFEGRDRGPDLEDRVDSPERVRVVLD